MSGTVDSNLLGDGPYRIGHLTLNAPQSLNSLTRDMVEILLDSLLAWRDDETVAAVFIDGIGDKAFCAGGDVQALRDSCLAMPGGPCEYAENFFAREYRMNYILHTYPKPVICWGHGWRARYSCGLQPPSGERAYSNWHARGYNSSVS